MELLLLLGYRPTLFTRDHNYFVSVGGFEVSDSVRKARERSLVQKKIVHSIVIVIVMISESHSRRHRTKRLFAVVQPKIPFVI